jgi:hypothetical protein
MFSNFELAVIEIDVSHVLKTVALDDKQKKTRESIVEKISSHNNAMPKLPDIEESLNMIGMPDSEGRDLSPAYVAACNMYEFIARKIGNS